MKRVVEVYGKYGVLEIVGNPQETILYLKNKPIHYSCYAEVGSTWRYHIAQGLNDQIVRVNGRTENLLKRGIKNEGDFLAVTEYFNSFFKYGKYEYGCYEMHKDMHFTDTPKSNNYESFDFYGGMLELSPTQNFIDNTAVEEYKEKILRGVRPVIILLHLQNSWMFYILDGHHKFHAYKKANIAPYAIIITKLESKYKSIEETIQLAKKMNCKNEDYIYWMKREKKNLSHYNDEKLDLVKQFKLIKGV